MQCKKLLASVVKMGNNLSVLVAFILKTEHSPHFKDEKRKKNKDEKREAQ